MVVVLLEQFKLFVEDDYVEAYKQGIEKYFGEGSCHILKIRKYGGMKVID